MRGYFEEDEPEAVPQPRRDTELTLGTGAVFGIFFVLLLVCGLCFGAGYEMGHRVSARGAAASAPTAAPDQEPLQGNNSIPKPSAAETSPAPQADDSTATQAAGDATNSTANGENATANGPGGSAQVQPALPGSGDAAPAAQPGAATGVHPALPSQAQWMVQIAAVRNAEDADVLETALRRRAYPVAAAREPADGLIHVRIGPFTSHDEANRWADKLLGDGYNAQVQP